MTITTTFSAPWFTGITDGSEVPARFHAALHGRPYLIDMGPKFGDLFTIQSIPQLAPQLSTAAPSEATINQEDLWRRSQDSWHHGAGQSYLDRIDSDPARFDTSKGVNVWVEGQMSLLFDTTRRLTSTATNLRLATAGGYLYVIDGVDLKFNTKPLATQTAAWSTVSGTAGLALQSICSDGGYVYVTDGSDVYRTGRGDPTATVFNTLDCERLAFVKGRLMAAHDNLVYNIVSSVVPAPLEVAASLPGDWRWTGFAEGPAAIYCAGYVGDKSIVFRTSVKTDGSGLDVLIPAVPLPDGEVVRSIQGYLGFVVIGTDKGVRFAEPDGTGNLILGSLIPATDPVLCFEPQDRFVWYGLTNYDGTSTGLGRLDLKSFTGADTPAYASDLMASAQGEILSAATFLGARVFTVSGSGVWAAIVSYVASGQITSGRINYQLSEPKVAMHVDVRHDTLGSHTVALSVDSAAFDTLGTHTAETSPFDVGAQLGNDFETRVTLTKVGSFGPTVRAVTLRAYPAVPTIDRIVVPYILADRLETLDQSEVLSDPQAELDAIVALHSSRALVSLQLGARSYPVVVQDYEWHPLTRSDRGSGWNGTCVVSHKVVI